MGPSSSKKFLDPTRRTAVTRIPMDGRTPMQLARPTRKARLATYYKASKEGYPTYLLRR